MSLAPPVLAQIAGSGLPLLCVDTCAVLDVMRDVTRELVTAANIQASLALLDAAEANPRRLWVLFAKQVYDELSANEQLVEAEADKHLKKFRAQAARIDQVAALYGAAGSGSTAHLAGHVAAARAVYDRWKRAGTMVDTSNEAIGRAFVRVNKGDAPASQGNQSMKDCAIVETYLEAMRDLRAAGFTSKAVMLSSNTRDYGGGTLSALRAPLSADFAAVGLDFAADHQFSRHLLGI